MKPNPSQKSYTVKEATLKLMQFCAYRDRSQKEVEDKLLEMGMIPAAREQITIKLMEENFLNEERFARSFVRGKFRINKWGRIKITEGLRQKEISSPIIKIALTEIDESAYFSTLYGLAERKSELINEKNAFKRKKKMTNYLLRRGFEANLVFDMVNDLVE